MNPSITVKSVPKLRPSDQPRVDIDGRVFNYQTLQRAVSNAANAPADSVETYVVSVVEEAVETPATSPA